MSARELLPCPFCGGDAEFGICPDEMTLASGEKIENSDAGGEFVQCTNKRCSASSVLIFPTMADAKPLLREKWNRRAHLSEPVRARELTREQIASIRYTLAGDGEGSYQAEDINALCDMALASLGPVAMPEPVAWNDEDKARLNLALFGKCDEPLAWISADGRLSKTKPDEIGIKWYPLYATARRELGDERIMEIARQHAEGFHLIPIMDQIEDAIRQALGESKP